MATVEQAQGLTAYTYVSLYTRRASRPSLVPRSPSLTEHVVQDFPVGTERVDLSGKEETVRYPMPDDNPNDPLTWTMRRKVSCFSALFRSLR